MHEAGSSGCAHPVRGGLGLSSRPLVQGLGRGGAVGHALRLLEAKVFYRRALLALVVLSVLETPTWRLRNKKLDGSGSNRLKAVTFQLQGMKSWVQFYAMAEKVRLLAAFWHPRSVSV